STATLFSTQLATGRNQKSATTLFSTKLATDNESEVYSYPVQY
ncbi:hypothetical protein RRG08_026888, partial [Elysia crispata]